MKRFLSIICLLVSLSLIAPTAALAVEYRSSDYFMCDSCYLNEASGTTFEVWFDVTSVRTMDELGVSVIKVQRSSDKSAWTNMKTFTKENYSQMIGTNTADHSDYVSYSGTSGYYYRAYVKFYAKKGSGMATLDRYTETILIP